LKPKASSVSNGFKDFDEDDDAASKEDAENQFDPNSKEQIM
jgi:hypothetical protein